MELPPGPNNTNSMCFKPWKVVSLLILVQLFLVHSFSSHHPVVLFSGSQSPTQHSNFYSKNKITSNLLGQTLFNLQAWKLMSLKKSFKSFEQVFSKYGLLRFGNLLILLASYMYSILVTNDHSFVFQWFSRNGC